MSVVAMDAPIAGHGLHEWILSESRRMLASGKSADFVKDQLEQVRAAKGRKDGEQPNEVSDAIDGALQYFAENGYSSGIGNGNGNGIGGTMSWEDVADLKLPSGSLDRRDRRKVRVGFNRELQESILRANLWLVPEMLKETASDFDFCSLFGELDGLVCAGKTVAKPEIRLISEWMRFGDKELREQAFIVPSFLIDRSRRCNENMRKRLYLVIEFDCFKEESISLYRKLCKQCRLFWHLGKLWDFGLAMLVFSGNESIHGWFPCFHKSKYKIRTFIRKAVELGADFRAVVPSQFVRMPRGYRSDTGKWQTVIYWGAESIRRHNEFIEWFVGVEEGGGA